MKKSLVALGILALLAACGPAEECSTYSFDFRDGKSYDLLQYSTNGVLDSTQQVVAFSGCEEQATAGFLTNNGVAVPFVRDATTFTVYGFIFTITKERYSTLIGETNGIVFEFTKP